MTNDIETLEKTENATQNHQAANAECVGLEFSRRK